MGNIRWFESLTRDDVATVGGKNASLGEMVRDLGSRDIRVPAGFATTAHAYRSFLDQNALPDLIAEEMQRLEAGQVRLSQAGDRIRSAIKAADWPARLRDEIVAAYAELGRRLGEDAPAVAVRSSATAEDLPDASFAGQQETFLNIIGPTAVLDACRRCYASLFTDRAVSYRQLKGFANGRVALSVGVQQMVRADLGGSGVMFSIDTESGFDRVVLMNAAWGLGETVVQGVVYPDEYQVYKPFLGQSGNVPIIVKERGSKKTKLIYADNGTGTKLVPTSEDERSTCVLRDEEIVALAKMAVTIERHYGRPMDIEWARDGLTQNLYVVQARPETVQSRMGSDALRTYRIGKTGPCLVKGLSVGGAVAAGPVCLIETASDIERFVEGSILVTSTTDPDWVPVMKRAPAIVTDHGGRTSHAAIVSRELGLPAVVGTVEATRRLRDGQPVTVSCAEGETGRVYDGLADFSFEETSLADVPQTRVKVMLNMADPATASRWWRLPADGVGLARMEFVISNEICVHPLALARFDQLEDPALRERIRTLTLGHDRPEDYFIDRLSKGLARIAAVHHPHPVIVRMSDFKSNEYAELLGGHLFEPVEENPMIGLRRLALLLGGLQGWLRAGMPGGTAPARGDGVSERGRHDPLLPIAGRGGPGARGDGDPRTQARRERPRTVRDVRDPVERHPCRRLCPQVRRVLDRLERPDAADPWCRP